MNDLVSELFWKRNKGETKRAGELFKWLARMNKEREQNPASAKMYELASEALSACEDVALEHFNREIKGHRKSTIGWKRGADKVNAENPIDKAKLLETWKRHHKNIPEVTKCDSLTRAELLKVGIDVSTKTISRYTKALRV